ncbi:hypothetical protein AAFP30_27905 [Gordonia sp. CPCC 205515]
MSEDTMSRHRHPPRSSFFDGLAEMAVVILLIMILLSVLAD